MCLQVQNKVWDEIYLAVDLLVQVLYLRWFEAKNTPNVGLEPTTLRLRVSCSTD